jgi:hypothetical protein
MRKKTAGKSAASGGFAALNFCTLNVDKIVSNASHIVKDH